MPKTPYIRTCFGKERVSGYEILIKSVRHHYCRMFPRICDKLSSKTSVLVRSEILGLFDNTLTALYKYYRHICRISGHSSKRSYLRKEKLFQDFL